MTPPLNLILLNTKKSDEISEINRRWIARVVPLCIAYDLHLILANFGIRNSPIEFARKMAPSTSIGKRGKRFIELAKKGWVQITELPLPENIGTTVICTSKPDKVKSKNYRDVATLVKKKKIALVFGCDEHRNQSTKRIMSNSNYHLDITGKKIKLGLDTEIGAVISILSKLKRD